MEETEVPFPFTSWEARSLKALRVPVSQIITIFSFPAPLQPHKKTSGASPGQTKRRQEAARPRRSQPLGATPAAPGEGVLRLLQSPRGPGTLRGGPERGAAGAPRGSLNGCRGTGRSPHGMLCPRPRPDTAGPREGNGHRGGRSRPGRGQERGEAPHLSRGERERGGGGRARRAAAPRGGGEEELGPSAGGRRYRAGGRAGGGRGGG